MISKELGGAATINRLKLAYVAHMEARQQATEVFAISESRISTAFQPLLHESPTFCEEDVSVAGYFPQQQQQQQQQASSSWSG